MLKDREAMLDSLVALKLLTNDCYGTGHDIFELEILQSIARQQAQLDNDHTSYVNGLIDNFQLNGPNGAHECIVMPVLGCSIKAQAERFPERRIPVRIMKEITRQLLKGLAFIHGRCKVIHTDLQPSNIL
ncbi:hypothetical protein B0A55_11927, partial [Friedmanniomyces simplex]